MTEYRLQLAWMCETGREPVKTFTEIARDNVSEPNAYLIESDSKETNSNREDEEDMALNTPLF
jgi:hypothetical protein